jgi:hypothetical protein
MHVQREQVQIIEYDDGNNNNNAPRMENFGEVVEIGENNSICDDRATVCVELVLTQLVLNQYFDNEKDVISMFYYFHICDSVKCYLNSYDADINGYSTAQCREIRNKIRNYIMYYEENPPQSETLQKLIEDTSTLLDIESHAYDGDPLANYIPEDYPIMKGIIPLLNQPLSADDFTKYKETGSWYQNPDQNVVMFSHVAIDGRFWSRMGYDMSEEDWGEPIGYFMI